MIKRRIDRARIMRGRRLWWERHGSFCLGIAAGVLLSLTGFLIARALLGGF